jgi:hypothetical protein
MPAHQRQRVTTNGLQHDRGIRFQNRLLVLTRWTVSFVTHGRGARLISETKVE